MKGDNLHGHNTHKNDELYTPRILVDVILPHISKDKTIWCPFDTINSEFVKSFKQNGYNVVHSHIVEGKDFLTYEPEHWDIIVSNPPFSLKMEILERVYNFNKPFALLMGIPFLNYHITGDFFIKQNSDVQFLFVNKRISFDGNPSSFNTSYVCRKLLARDIIFTNIENNNANQYYIPSEMENDRDKICKKI